MAFGLRYHPATTHDVSRLSEGARGRIRAAIEERLTNDPLKYGEPLRGTLKGYRKLRVGDYRVVFTIEESTVYVLGICHRREIYARMKRRSR